MPRLRRRGAPPLLLVLCAALPATAAAAPATIVDLQATRSSQQVPLPDPHQAGGRLTLTSLNPAANAWLLLTLQAPGALAPRDFHLENADPAGQRVTLDRAAPGSLLLATAQGVTRCGIWPGDALAQAARSPLPFAPLCGGRLFLRQRVPASRSALEATAGFLRDHVWQGDALVDWVKRGWTADAFTERPAAAASASADGPAPPQAPPAASLAGPGEAPVLALPGLGLDLGQPTPVLRAGQWRAAAGLRGVYASALQPGLLAKPPADAAEAAALVYLVAFDLASHGLGFALGNDHPRLGWAARVPAAAHDARLPGPDGIDDAAPLVRVGMVPPPLQPRTVATFTGGFKREHGAFHAGPLAAGEHGSHYGFIEQGVVFSKLQPGLATLLVLDDGSVEMRTWTRADNRRLAAVRDARQNGAPLLEPGPGGGSVIGALVHAWAAGNWSGSSDGALRTLRAGVCLIDGAHGRFLVYGYFSDATPPTMARVFQAYGCSHAMHLDMNALEHTYFALYPRAGTRRGIEHLVPGMAVLDGRLDGTVLPRFLGRADNRDFFYVVDKEGAR